MPNRRRRRLSTAMSAVAAVAVASPFAVTAVTALTASPQPAPEKHNFVQAAIVTDLPGEIISALQSSLSQFGIQVPNMPSIFGPTSTPAGSTPMTGPTVNTPPPTSLNVPTTSQLNDPLLAKTDLTPGLLTSTTPAETAATPGLFTPGVNSTTTSPLGVAPTLTPSEMPITASLGPDALYPVTDPSLLAVPTTPAQASGSLVSALSSVASEGTSQVIDLLKGIIAMAKTAAPAAAPAADAAAAAVPATP